MLRALIAAAAVPLSLVALDVAGVAQMTQANAPESKGRRICRTQGETGSLAARRRTCFTKAEWDRIAEEQRKSSRHILESVADGCGVRGEGGRVRNVSGKRPVDGRTGWTVARGGTCIPH